MKRRPCPSCGTPFQNGSIVWRVLPDGPQRQRVCKPCASLAVLVLASDTPARCEQCGKQLARFCGGCVAKLVAKGRGVRPLVDAARRRGIERGSLAHQHELELELAAKARAEEKARERG